MTSSLTAEGDSLIVDLNSYRQIHLPQVSTMTCLHATLFGDFELRDKDGEELKLRTRKTRALLAFLIVEADRWHTRERLAGLLWSDRQQAQARHSLTQALSTIRKLGEKAGEQLIESDSERVRLLAGAVECDALSFRGARDGDLHRAAEFYAGPLLDGFVSPDEVFDEWLRAERAAYQGAACTAFRSLVEQAEANRDLSSAISAAERLLALDQLDEATHRHLMRLYAESGNRSEAVRQFEKCERVLRDELGVAPSAETRAVLEAVKLDDIPTTNRLKQRDIAIEDAEDQALHGRSDRPSIAVLPFENLSSDPEQAFFADGMAEDLITALSRFRSLTVVPRNSTFSYKSQVPDIERIGQELGVRYVVEGSVRRAGNRIRISAQLIDSSTGDLLWTDRFDRDVVDIFAVQDEATDAITSAISPEIDKAERARAQRKSPENLDAWTLYQQGLTAYHATTEDGIEKAIDLFDRATKADPEFAPAFAYAADARLRKMLHYFGVQDQLLDEAAKKSRTAVGLDNRDPNSLLVSARVHSLLGSHETAIAHARDAVSLNPSSPMCRYALGFVLGQAGNGKEALMHIEAAVRLGPRDIFLPGYLQAGALIYFDEGRYEEALEWARRASSSPNPRATTYHFVVAALMKMGRREEANTALSNLLSNAQRYKTLDSFSEVLHRVWPTATQRNKELVDALREAGLPD